MTQFLKQHERLILGLALLAVLLYLSNKWINHVAAEASVKNAIAQQDLQTQKDRTAQLEKDAQQRDQQYQQTFAVVQQEIQVLQNAINARDAQLVKQREADKVLPLPDLAARWEDLIGVKGDIVNTNGNIQVGPTAAHATVDQLETVPVLQQNVKDDAAIISDREQEISTLTSAYTACQAQTTGLQDEVKKEVNACQAQTNNLKAQARKSKRNWFIAGIVTGAAVVARIVW